VIEVRLTLGAVAIGFAVWHIAKVMDIGSLFQCWRDWLDKQPDRAWDEYIANPTLICRLKHRFWCKAAEGWSCRLCFGTQWSLLLTTTTLVVTLLSYGTLGLPVGIWVLMFVLGPFTVAAIAEAMRKFE